MAFPSLGHRALSCDTGRAGQEVSRPSAEPLPSRNLRDQGRPARTRPLAGALPGEQGDRAATVRGQSQGSRPWLANNRQQQRWRGPW